jgi:hypothetical protein
MKRPDEESSYSSLMATMNEAQGTSSNSQETIKKLEDELETEKKKRNDQKHKYENILMEVEALQANKTKIEAELRKALIDNRILRDICSQSCQNLNQSANEAMLKLREIVNYSMKMKETANKTNKSIEGCNTNLRSCGTNTDISGESYGYEAFSDETISNKNSMIEQLTNSNYDLERQIEAITNTNYSSEWMMILADEWKEMRLRASQEKRLLDP